MSTDVPFVEVYLNTPIEVCEARDSKHLYARARTGVISEFTGISAPFEPPDCPTVRLDTSKITIGEATHVLLQVLEPQICILNENPSSLSLTS